jgi:hypothetical protein
MARVGLGAFGVVTEVTIQCIPRHQLMETTVVLSRVEVGYWLLYPSQHFGSDFGRTSTIAGGAAAPVPSSCLSAFAIHVDTLH